jgi:hypothetical protein
VLCPQRGELDTAPVQRVDNWGHGGQQGACLAATVEPTEKGILGNVVIVQASLPSVFHIHTCRWCMLMTMVVVVIIILLSLLRRAVDIWTLLLLKLGMSLLQARTLPYIPPYVYQIQRISRCCDAIT